MKNIYAHYRRLVCTIAAILGVSMVLLTFGQAYVEFQHDSLVIDEGTSMTVCLELGDADINSNDYIVEVAFKPTSLPHFAGQHRKIITFQEKTFCFTLTAGLHTQSQSNTEYTLGLSVISTEVLRTGNRFEMTVIVTNVEPASSALGTKSLSFIAYDNEIDETGADQISLMNTVPITAQTSFTLTSAEYDTVSNTNMWFGRDRGLLSAVRITYIGTTTIPTSSVIEFKIAPDPMLGDRLVRFEINDVPSTAFTVQNIGATTAPDLGLSTNAPSSLYLIDGIFEVAESQYSLRGSPVDGIHVGFTNPVPLPPSLDGNSVIVTQTGSTWGIIDCGNGEIYLCDFQSLVGNVTSWSVASGTNANNLPADILNAICDVEECPEGEITFFWSLLKFRQEVVYR